MPTPIERLQNLKSVNVKNAGRLLLAAILTPIVTATSKVAELFGAILNIPIRGSNAFARGLGEFLVAFLAGIAGYLDAAFLAGEQGLQSGVWATLGPFVPLVGWATVLALGAMTVWYLQRESSADTLVGMFSATDLPFIGADEEAE